MWDDDQIAAGKLTVHDGCSEFKSATFYHIFLLVNHYLMYIESHAPTAANRLTGVEIISFST